MGQHLVRVPAVGTDAGYRDLGQLPAVALPDLGSGDLELLANPSEQATHDLPLRLEGTGIGKVKG